MNNMFGCTDNERPDLEAAAAALSTISNLTPDIIRGKIEKIKFFYIFLSYRMVNYSFFFNFI